MGNVAYRNLTISCTCAVLAACAQDPASVTLDGPASLPMVTQADLQYRGAFRVPSGNIGSSSFHYGGTALTFNPDNNSLFVVGHDWNQQVAEISIPTIVNSGNVTDLVTAEVLQTFGDITDGMMYQVDEGSIKIGGLFVEAGQLYGTAYSYYDADGSQTLSHFRSPPTTLQPNDADGMFQLSGTTAGFVSGYMTRIPPEWVETLGATALTGQCCLSIIGRTSSGPGAFAFTPSAMGAGVAVAATPLFYYPLDHPLAAWDATNMMFNGSTEITGVVFPDGTRSLLFFGRQGIGQFCYGTGEACADPANGSQGTHAYPYVQQVWVYDVAEVMPVLEGAVEPWTIRPSDVWELELPFHTDGARLGGATYDPDSRDLFVSQLCVEGDCLPVIHVFRLKGD